MDKKHLASGIHCGNLVAYIKGAYLEDSSIRALTELLELDVVTHRRQGCYSKIVYDGGGCGKE